VKRLYGMRSAEVVRKGFASALCVPHSGLLLALLLVTVHAAPAKPVLQVTNPFVI